MFFGLFQLSKLKKSFFSAEKEKFEIFCFCQKINRLDIIPRIKATVSTNLQ
jgi:hypothetical protein